MDIKNYIGFMDWADNRVKDKVKQVSDDHFNQADQEGRSLRQLVEHFINSYEYLTYHGDFKERIDELAEMSRDELMGAWDEAWPSFRDQIAEMEDKTYSLPTGKDKKAELSFFDYLLVYTDHQTYHRGQVNLRLRQLGYEPNDTDYYSYFVSIT